MSDVLLEQTADGVTTLTLNRPDNLNALNPELYDRLSSTLARLADDPQTGVVVLTGAGRAFSAGGDVKGMPNRAQATFEESVEAMKRRTETSRLLHEMHKPTIAMINGLAYGAGFAIALACDMRFAAQSATFNTAFGRIGLPGDFGGTFFLTHLVGPAKAKELFFTAETIDSAAALGLGLLNRTVADAELASTTLEIARKLAAGPRLAYRYMKTNINAVTRGLSLPELLDQEALFTSRARQTEDHREATSAFAEKRQPVFKGR